MNDVLDKQKLVLNANLLGKILSVYWRSFCKESEIFYSINVFLKLIIYIYIYYIHIYYIHIYVEEEVRRKLDDNENFVFKHNRFLLAFKCLNLTLLNTWAQYLGLCSSWYI